MKKFIVLITIVFMFSGSLVFADDNYFNLKGMVVDQNDLNPSGDVELDGVVTDKSGFGFAMALGHRFGDFRVEAQYARRNVSINARDESRDHEKGNDFNNGLIRDLDADEIEARKREAGIDGKITAGTFESKRTQNKQHIHTDSISTKGGKYRPYKKDAKGKYVYEKEDDGSFTEDRAGNKINVLLAEKDFKYDREITFADPSVFFNEDELIIQTAMANGYYDFHLGALSPYIGAGLGVGFINLEDEANFAWQVMAGVSFPVTKAISASVGWTRLDAGEVKIRRGSHTIKTNTDSNSVDFGITYSF